MFSVMIIGCGRMAGLNKLSEKISHGSAIIGNEQLNIIACVDLDSKKALDFSRKYYCNPYSDLDLALSEERCNIITICSSDYSHFEITQKVLNSKNKPNIIFLEKPCCQSMDEYYVLKELSEKEKIPIIVNHSRRFNIHMISLKKQISNNKFGKLLRVSASYYNGWLHNASHLIDTIIFLTNKSMIFKRAYNRNFCSHANDYTFDMMGQIKDKNIPLDIKAIDERYYQLFEFDLWFSKARIRLENFGGSIIYDFPRRNKFSEIVLENRKIPLPNKNLSEIEFAYSIICTYLKKNDDSILEEFTLNKLEHTMKALFQGMEILKQNL